MQGILQLSEYLYIFTAIHGPSLSTRTFNPHMKKFRLSISLIFLSAAVSLHAQGDFKPGYIILTDQDTIHGQIKINSEARNARTCIFRTDENAEASSYGPGEINAYRITGGKYYVSHTIEEEGQQKEVFLEYLVNGMADLYYLRNDNSEAYFIQKEGENVLELTDIRLLKAAFSDCYEIQPSLDRATLSHKSLVGMTVKYHDYVCDGEVCINYSKESSGLKVQVGPVAGYFMSPVRLNGAELFEAFDFGNTRVPMFGVQIRLGSQRLGEHVSFQFGTQYSQHSFQTMAEVDGKLYYVDYNLYDVHMESHLLTLQLGSRYTFRGKSIRPFMGGGLESGKFINTDFGYTEERHFINWDPDMVSETWTGNPVANVLFGAYAEVGLDVQLSRKLVLEAAIRAGYLTSNPNTLMALRAGSSDPMRVRPEMIPLSLQIGILF